MGGALSVGEYSPLHDIRSAVSHLLILFVMKPLSWFCYRSFEKDTKNAMAVQNKLLAMLIEDNKHTQYGKKWNFHEIQSREDFQQAHPVTSYDHYKEYIDSIAIQGDPSILTSYPFVKLALTSGTSGSRKMLPFTKKQRSVFFVKGITVLYHELLQITGFALQKTCKFMYSPTKRFTESNIPMGPNSSSPEDSKSLMCMFTTPIEGYVEISNEQSALYVHLLFALKDYNLGQFEANFISIIFHAFQFLLHHWEELEQDIRNGTVSEKYEIPLQTRLLLNKKLRGSDNKRADWIRKAFEEGTKDIAIRLWPKLKCVTSVNTGPFQLYDQKLLEYIPASVPRFSPLYAASEGLMGLNLTPNGSEYILVPGAMFFEFIPVEGEQKIALFMDQVEIGVCYELVITNMSGLYRYRMGDVIKVVGRYNSAVKIEFQYRKGQLINIRGEKTSEKSFYEALRRVIWPSRLLEYTCIDPALVFSSEMPRYEIYVELEDETNIDTERTNRMFDEALCDINPIYLSFREKGSIALPVIHRVHSGTFAQIHDNMVANGTGINQVKIPRVTRYDAHIELLRNSKSDK